MVSAQLHAPAALLPMKNPFLTHWTGSGFLRKDRSLLALLGIQPGFLGHTADRVVTTLTELSLLTKRLTCDTKNEVCGGIIVTTFTKVLPGLSGCAPYNVRYTCVKEGWKEKSYLNQIEPACWEMARDGTCKRLSLVTWRQQGPLMLSLSVSLSLSLNLNTEEIADFLSRQLTNHVAGTRK